MSLRKDKYFVEIGDKRKMKRVLFFAYTPFQVIAALAIKDQYYTNDMADIILPESIQSREYLKENITKYGLFDKTYLVSIRKIFPKAVNKKKHEFNRVKSAFSPFYIANDIGIIDTYDVFVTTEINYYTESIYAFLYHKNRNVVVELMDEGYSSYTYYFKEAYRPSSKKNRVKSLLFKVPGRFYNRKFIAEQAKLIYFFAPELLCWENIPYEIKKIDVLGNIAFLERINLLFGYFRLKETGIEEEYDKKFLYFEECFFWTSGNCNDIEIIDHIAEIVGQNNMAIKLHPRNEINRFETQGYKTNSTPGIPWELIAINLPDNDEMVFLSFSSGAVLNYKFLTNKNFKTILLYKCIGDRYYHVDDSVKKWFEKFEQYYGNSIFIPNTQEELDNLLISLKK